MKRLITLKHLIRQEWPPLLLAILGCSYAIGAGIDSPYLKSIGVHTTLSPTKTPFGTLKSRYFVTIDCEYPDGTHLVSDIRALLPTHWYTSQDFSCYFSGLSQMENVFRLSQRAFLRREFCQPSFLREEGVCQGRPSFVTLARVGLHDEFKEFVRVACQK